MRTEERVEPERITVNHRVKRRDEMSPSLTANQSFLHGNRKAAVISEKVVYATLDSLALKRARLPLQLLPVDNGNVVEKADKEKRPASGKTSPKRPTYKVKSGASHQWKSYSKYLVFSSTKSQNQSARSIEVVDSGTVRNVENALEEKIDTRANTTELIENSMNTCKSIFIDGESRIEGFSNDNNDNLVRPQTEEYSRNDANVVEDQSTKDEKEKCSVGRRDSGSSSDYEKMNVTDCKMSTLEKTAAFDSEASYKAIEIVTYIDCSKITTKSKSVNDLVTQESTCESDFVIYSKYNEGSITSDEEKDPSSRQKKKKKKRFTRNVFHYVPRHLVKQPKKKLKKKYALSSSLSSLRSFQTAPKTVRDSCGTRSVCTEAPKRVTISSPTNFVHVASATNPSLISNVRIDNLEQVVITHQQICATLPLLIEKNYRRTDEKENAEWSKVIADMSTVKDVISSQSAREVTVQRLADKSTNYAKIKSDSSRDPQLQAAKVSEIGQIVKTSIGNQAGSLDGETYEPVYEPSSQVLPRANSSFLWSNHRTKSFPNDTRVSEENESADSEEYDDVGPSNFNAQTDSDYDDVGPLVTREVEVTAKDCEEIYDDVMPLGSKRDSSAVDEEDDYLIPGEVDRIAGNAESSVELRATTWKDCSEGSSVENQYFSANNEYSIVDEGRLNEEERDELGVYDDVDLPSEERVNSIYAGSAPNSILRLTATNDKESEWEDLEETSRCPCHSAKENGEQTVEDKSSKKKFAQRWSRKVRQRSRRSRRNAKVTTQTSLDRLAHDVAVSLGGGSILLIGESDKIAGEWKLANQEDDLSSGECRTQGLVQLRVLNLDEDVDIQETSCYVHEDSASDDSTYESLYSCQAEPDLSTDSEAETKDKRQRPYNNANDNSRVNNPYLGCPTRPTPPPPREASLTQTLGRRIKMLRRTWSITKDSLGRIRRRTSVNECLDDKEQSGNEHHHHVDTGKYFNFRKHFRKNIVSPPTFYIDGNERNEICSSRNNNSTAKETIYTNSQYMGSSSDDSSKFSVTDVDHYSVLADQEPLYQFYAAAVARVAFESDSEGYEEVEDTIWKTESTASDLGRSGQRMLWCHTPQVIRGGLLQRLTAEEKKIQEAKFEILTSEASYLNSLRVLENEFLNNQTLMNEILTSLERKKLFDGVPSVLSASRAFLAELEAVWREDPMLPGLSDVLLKHAEKCQETYVAYCSNQVSIDTTLKELRARKGVKFLEAIRRIEMRPACQNLSLHSFLMLPMQRVTRLPLLADAVLSKLSMGSSDRESWERVLSSLSNVVAECNEGARTATQEAEMEALARKLEYSTKIKPIMLRGKQLVRSGSVVQLSTKTDTEYKLTFGKKFNKTSLYLLLLTDYLLITKLKSNTHDECYTVIDACKRNLLALESASEESPFAGRNAMILTLLENHFGRHVEYVLTCENNTERERWLEAVSPPKRGLIGETLYESWDCPQIMAKYPYSPNQPDELTLQPGDIINVLRKMADGWYHGEKLVDGEQGWFPANHTKEVASEHVRARNLKQRHRLLALSSSVIQQRRAKQNQGTY